MDSPRDRRTALDRLLRIGLFLALPAIVAVPVRGEEEGGTPP